MKKKYGLETLLVINPTKINWITYLKYLTKYQNNDILNSKIQNYFIIIYYKLINKSINFASK
jgi:hypothetical protein